MNKDLLHPLIKNGPYCLSHTDVVDICDSAVGVHAARPQTPFMSIVSRNHLVKYTYFHDLMYQSRELIRVRCMRNTLHITTKKNARILHFATLRQRLARCQSLIAKVRNFDEYHNRAQAWIEERMELHGKITERSDELIAQQTEGIPVLVFRLTLKKLWELGIVCFNDESNYWAKEQRYFCGTIKCYGAVFKEFEFYDEFYYQLELCRMYYNSFGPATIRDFSWWSGLPLGICDKLTKKLIGENLNYFDYEGMRFFQFGHENISIENLSDDVYLLPWEDYSLKAYFESRFRYGSPKVLEKAYNSIGEIRRSIVVRGRIVGVWDVDCNGIPAEINLFHGEGHYKKKAKYAMRELIDTLQSNCL